MLLLWVAAVWVEEVAVLAEEAVEWTGWLAVWLGRAVVLAG